MHIFKTMIQFCGGGCLPAKLKFSNVSNNSYF